MLQIVALKAEHMLAVPLQSAQGWEVASVTPDAVHKVVGACGVGATALLDGTPIACAGIVPLHAAHGQAWALFSDVALAHFKTIHRVIRAVLDASRWRRVDMHVDCQHVKARQWAERLGFVCEGRMRCVTPDGRDCWLYARIKGE